MQIKRPINMFASVVDKCGYLFRFIQKCVNLGVPKDCFITGRNLSIINKQNLGKYKKFKAITLKNFHCFSCFQGDSRTYITKTAIFKEFPGLENKFQNPRGFKEIKDSWEQN